MPLPRSEVLKEAFQVGEAFFRPFISDSEPAYRDVEVQRSRHFGDVEFRNQLDLHRAPFAGWEVPVRVPNRQNQCIARFPDGR